MRNFTRKRSQELVRDKVDVLDLLDVVFDVVDELLLEGSANAGGRRFDLEANPFGAIPELSFTEGQGKTECGPRKDNGTSIEALFLLCSAQTHNGIVHEARQAHRR